MVLHSPITKLYGEHHTFTRTHHVWDCYNIMLFEFRLENNPHYIACSCPDFLVKKLCFVRLFLNQNKDE